MTLTNSSLSALKLFAALGCGLIAGVFFAFSTFVMPALAKLQPAQGIVAMKSINIAAINPLFMFAMFGTAAACLFLAIASLFKWRQPDTVYILISCLLYLVGAVGVTIAFNVPLNDALAIAKPNSPEGARFWANYLTNWTFWNHVRTVASLAAATLLTMALY
jgi:uncharacterized membrane protein